MKLLFAECCNSIVVPNRQNNIVTYCPCKQSAVWWIDGSIGHLGVYSWAIIKVSVLGIMNNVLTATCGSWVDKEQMKEIMDNCPDNYLFKTINSAIVRFRPTYSNDTFFFNDKSKIPGLSSKRGDSGSAGEELLESTPEIERKRRVIHDCVRDGIFSFHEALGAYGITEDEYFGKLRNRSV